MHGPSERVKYDRVMSENERLLVLLMKDADGLGVVYSFC